MHLEEDTIQIKIDLKTSKKQNIKKLKGCEYHDHGRNKDKISGQVSHCSFYFVLFLIFLVKKF